MSEIHLEREANTRAHVFDGIREFENRLPNWWLWTFYITCIFALVYWIHYHTLGTGDLPQEEYAKEKLAAQALEDAISERNPTTDESLMAMAKDSALVAKGKEVYTTNCVACHLATGGGLVGPNLTDAYWLHGSSPTAIHKTIVVGVPEKGMQPWKATLGPSRIQQVTAYLLTLKNTNVAAGKAPEGTKEAQ